MNQRKSKNGGRNIFHDQIFTKECAGRGVDQTLINANAVTYADQSSLEIEFGLQFVANWRLPLVRVPFIKHTMYKIFTFGKKSKTSRENSLVKMQICWHIIHILDNKSCILNWSHGKIIDKKRYDSVISIDSIILNSMSTGSSAVKVLDS